MSFALQAGSCFRPDLYAANHENGCYASWLRTYGVCALPTLEEITSVVESCQDEWTSGDIGEGEACTYGMAGCAAPESPELRSTCRYDWSTEIGGGVCTWVSELPRGVSCEPAALEYCNRTDACLSSGVCGPRRALGESCEVDNDCASHLCASGVRTDPEGFSCAERSCPTSWSCVDQRCARIVRR